MAWQDYGIGLILCGEIISMGWWYQWGVGGKPLVEAQQHQLEQVQQQIQDRSQAIASLKESVAAWESDPLRHEWYGRTHLHMARPEEKIYLLSPRA